MTTQIDKTKIPLGVLVLIVQALITYMASQFGTQAAIKQLQYETQIQINELKYEDKLLWNRVNMIASNTYRHEAIMPKEMEEPRPEVKDLK